MARTRRNHSLISLSDIRAGLVSVRRLDVLDLVNGALALPRSRGRLLVRGPGLQLVAELLLAHRRPSRQVYVFCLLIESLLAGLTRTLA